MGEREYSERPWGNYTVLDDDAPDHKVKRIVVHPGKRLSYQRHAKRAEHWFIVSGTATVTLDGVVHEVHAGESIDIPLESAHRIANEGDTDVVFIEVQRGTYFGEDDIVRLEDDYGRIEGRPTRGRRRRDPHRRAPRPGPHVLVRILPSEERQGADHAARGPWWSCSRWNPRSSRSPTGAARSRASAPSTWSRACCTRRTLNPMAHLICVAHTRLELADILVSLRKAGVENLMALGGDPPEDPSAGPGELAYAAELVRAGPRDRRILHRGGRPSGRPSAVGRPP